MKIVCLIDGIHSVLAIAFDNTDSHNECMYRLTHGYRGDTRYTRGWLIMRPEGAQRTREA